MLENFKKLRGALTRPFQDGGATNRQDKALPLTKEQRIENWLELLVKQDVALSNRLDKEAVAAFAMKRRRTEFMNALDKYETENNCMTPEVLAASRALVVDKHSNYQEYVLLNLSMPNAERDQGMQYLAAILIQEGYDAVPSAMLDKHRHERQAENFFESFSRKIGLIGLVGGGLLSVAATVVGVKVDYAIDNELRDNGRAVTQAALIKAQKDRGNLRDLARGAALGAIGGAVLYGVCKRRKSPCP
ncbi:MAG: hypothetical protein WBK91_11065 [Alphaproteobacteria bacterium]